MQIVICVSLGMPLMAACDDNSNDDSSQHAAVGVDASSSAEHSSSSGGQSGSSSEHSSEHAATQVNPDGGSGHSACTQAYAVDPRDETMTGELVRLTTNDNGTADDTSDDQYDLLLPKEMTDWLSEQNWIQEHGDWHNTRRCAQKNLGPLPKNLPQTGAPVSIMTKDDLAARGLKCAAIQEGEPGDGLAFMAMHRHMIRGFEQAFPKHVEVIRGFRKVPVSKDDAENPLPWVDVKWSEDLRNSMDWMENIAEHKSEFESEDDYSKWVQFGDQFFGAMGQRFATLPSGEPAAGFPGAMPADADSDAGIAAAGGAGALPMLPSSPDAGTTAANGGMSKRPPGGIHGQLHGQWTVRNSPSPLVDNDKNVKNFAFWRLHGWIDDMWQRYRDARGLSEDDADYQQLLLEQCEEMHELGKAPPPAEPKDSGMLMEMETGKFATEVAPILSAACGGSVCHGADAPTLGLVLAGTLPSVVRQGLVGQRAREYDMALVEPGAPEQSWLYRKITDNFAGMDCTKTSCTAMPLGGMALSKDEIERIERWIADGATAD